MLKYIFLNYVDNKMYRMIQAGVFVVHYCTIVHI